MISRIQLISTVLFLLGIVGCAVSPDNQAGLLDIASPENFSADTEMSPFRNRGWLLDFNDPTLDQLVVEALEHNYNLQAAAARLKAAMAETGIVSSFQFPQLNVDASTGRSKQVFELPGGKIDTSHQNRSNLGIGVFWEVDLWGRLKNRTQAALADFEAEEEFYRAARLSLAANTLKLWFHAVESELQVELAQDSLNTFESNQEIVENGYRRGITSPLDVHLTRANVEAARSALNRRRRIRSAAARSLEVLLGRYPSNEIAIADEVPALNQPVPVGLPSKLLSRRPELAASERYLAAALERGKASRKDLLPNISLTGRGGSSSSDLQDLLDAERIAWNIAGNLAQPVFQGGRLLSQIRFSDAQVDRAFFSYSQSVLLAFQEVETLLTDAIFLRKEEKALRLAVDESINAESLAWEQYQRGLGNVITVLESQRRSFNSKSSLIQLTNARLQTRLDLYLALGGEFFPSGQSGSEGTDEVEGKGKETEALKILYGSGEVL